MKTSSFTTLLILLFSSYGLLVSQDSETRNLNDFDGISVSSGIEANLVKGSKNSISITAKGIDIDKVTTKVDNGVLKVGIDNKWWKNLGKSKKRDVEVTITYDGSLDYVSSSSGSSVEANHTVTSDDLHVKTSSGASMHLDIEANEVEVDVSSGSAMKLAGQAQSIGIDISSGASLNAYDLVGEEVDVDGSSGSTVKVHATRALNVDVSSGASVKYKGEPRTTDFDKSSGGSVRKV